MKTINKLVLSVTLLLCCLISVFAQQSTSSNYQLLQYGFVGGSPSQADPPASSNYQLEANAVGGIANDAAGSSNYNFQAGYYMGSTEGTSILPPENVTISIQSDSVHISWDTAIGATSYSVYSSTDPYADPEVWTLEQQGITDTTWAEPISGIPGTKKFYYVKSSTEEARGKITKHLSNDISERK